MELLAIQQAYESMLKDIQPFINVPNQLELIDKAYRYCLDEYDGRYLLSGKPYMMHLIEMGRIAVLEVGLGYISVVAAFLHGIDYKKDVSGKELKELFGKTVAENIRMDWDWATEEDIARAARIAQADTFIEQLPEKYDTVLAQRGMSLSGGQRQRLAIARAVLKKADVLVFDDATSALDLKTEADRFDTLGRECPDLTKVIVAQRIATVKRGDRIVVLSEGRISGIGRHEELLENNAIYKDIYESQMGKDKDN